MLILNYFGILSVCSKVTNYLLTLNYKIYYNDNGSNLLKNYYEIADPYKVWE